MNARLRWQLTPATKQKTDPVASKNSLCYRGAGTGSVEIAGSPERGPGSGSLHSGRGRVFRGEHSSVRAHVSLTIRYISASAPRLHCWLCADISMTLRSTLFAAVALCAALPAIATAQTLSQAESDPGKIGWMEGFPPAPDKLVLSPQHAKQY